MIFSEEAEAMLLQNKLNNYLLIEVEEHDKLPKHICIQCCTKLQTVCDFIDTARKAQEELLKRSIMLGQVVPKDCVISLVTEEVKPDVEENSDSEDKYVEIEVSVDPMMVLQNCEDSFSPSCYDHDTHMGDVTYLHGLDTENVTIKLIKKDDTQCSISDDDKRQSDDGDEDQKGMGIKPFPCPTCTRSFHTELALKNHNWVHTCETKTDKQYKCNTCSESFEYKYNFISHLKEHRANGLCQICGRMFRSEKTYVAHMSVHLPSTTSFTCKICGRSYNTWGGLKTHSVTHSTERPYQCHFCKKTFKRNQDLKFHINQHTGAKPYKCPFCEKSFASSGNCYSHRSRMHPGKQPEGHIRKWNIAPREPLTLRPIAPKPSNYTTAINGIVKYKCSLCDHSFAKKDNYTCHMYQHTGEKPFHCSFCSDKFMTRRGLLIHHDNKHPGKDRPLALISKNLLLK
ncbi:zinc finger protein 567-like isoform X2 [Trichoplusia ni]|nr:zinc finger protein 567-like isoform X2 [Trichoplusia ni]